MNPTSQLTQIGKYKILSELGRGGMGVVYHAEDKFIGREVAIKTLADTTPEMRQRFAIEARSGVLNHPNIVTVYDFGEHEGNPYIVMEFLRGLTLDRVVKENHPLAPVEKLDIVRQVCEGLGYAHSRGVVHRDIKPANVVLLQNGGVKLVDFGIAQLESLSGHTVAGSVIGTYQYLSPERLKGEPSDGRADIWSAGVLLYLLLTGTLPFPGEDISALHRVITDPYPPLGSLLSTAYPESLDNIVARALAKDPARRYATALEMAGDLEDARDALRLSRVEDLLGQARSLIEKDELLRARPLLLDLQRLAPQNTAVRNLLRELQTRLGQGSDASAGAYAVPGRHETPAFATNGAARPPVPGDAVAGAVQAGPAVVSPAPPAPPPPPALSGEEERRRRIIEQIVVEIRTQAERGNGVRALELVGRSLERAPGNAALLALQEELRGALAAAELSLPSAPKHSSEPAVPAVLPEPVMAEPASPSPAAEVAVSPVPQAGPEPPSELLLQAASALAPAAASQTRPTPAIARATDPVPGPRPKPVALPMPLPAAVPALAFAEPQPAAPAPAMVAVGLSESPAAAGAIGKAVSAIPAPPATTPELPLTVAAPEGLPAAVMSPSPGALAAPSAAPQLLQAAATSAMSPGTTRVDAASGESQPASAQITAVDRPVLRPEARQKQQDSEASQPAPAMSARRSGLLMLAAVAAGLLLAVLLLALRHQHRAAALPATYALLVASPYARVLHLTASNGESVPLPAGDHLTPLRVDGLRPGTYTLEIQKADGGTMEAHCSLDAQGHLCLATVAPLSEADLKAILNGGTHP